MAKNYDDDLAEIENLLRIGTVIKVKGDKAKVRFEEYDNMISDDLTVVFQNKKWTPDINDTVICLFIPYGDGDGYILGRL